MKKKLLTSILFFCLVTISFCQEKTNYNKDVYPLIKDQKYVEAIPMLEQFLLEKPTHVNANYWYAKINQALGEKNSDPVLIEKAIKHYYIVADEVSDLEMTMATAGRYPDVSGIESTDRLNNFKTFLRVRVVELKKYNEILISKVEQKKNDQLKAEVELKKQAELDLKIQKFDFFNFTLDDVITNIGLVELKSLLNKFDSSQNKEENIDPISFQFDGFFEYNIIDKKKTLNGKIDVNFGIGNTIQGEIHNGNGYIIIGVQDQDFHMMSYLKLFYSTGICKRFRLEKKSLDDKTLFIESDYTNSFDANKYFFGGTENLGLSEIPKTMLGSIEKPLTKFIGYSNSEEEGADVAYSNFTFVTVEKRGNQYSDTENMIKILEENTSPMLATQLKNESLNGRYYKLKGEGYTIKSEIYPQFDTVFILKELSEVKIFSFEDYANKYSETVTSSEFNTLNAVVKKWHSAIMTGNYEAYKAVSPKAKYMSLSEFTKANGIFNNNKEDYILLQSTKALKISGDLIIKSNNIDDLKNTGCDVKTIIVLYGLFNDLSKAEVLPLIKENGVWKVYGEIEKFNRPEEAKAYRVLTTENITACDCAKKVISGDQYNADKCAFFLSKGNRKAIEEQFNACFNTLNYCDYNKQMKLLGFNLYSNYELLKACGE